MAQLSTLLSLNTAPTSRSAPPKTSSVQSDKRPLETSDAPETASSENASEKGQTLARAEKSRFEKLLEEGKREQEATQPPADTNPEEPQPASAQEPAPLAMALLGGNPLPPEGQTLPPAEGMPSAAPSTLFASSQALPTLFDLKGRLEGLLEGASPEGLLEGSLEEADASLFGNAVSPTAPVQGAAGSPTASLFANAAAGPMLDLGGSDPSQHPGLFVDAAAGAMLAANDASVLAGMSPTPTQSSSDVTGGGLQAIMASPPQESAGQAAVSSTQIPSGGAVSAASEPGATGVAQPASAVPGQGLDALTAVAQPDSALQSAAQSAISTDEESTALAEATGAAVTATASAEQPQGAASAEATPTSSAQVQAAEIAWQPDAAERARAWRSISTLDPASGLLQGAGQGLTPTGRHEFSINNTAVAGQGGQLQQFAEALRQAGGGVEAGSQSLSQSLVQTGAQSTAAPATTQAADRSASAANASSPGPELQQAWRGDSAASGVTVVGGRAAAGALNFAQGMQASNFGQPLGQSFGDSEWAESVTKRVALMAGQKVSSAQIELDPPELGAMTVRVSVTGDQANVMFTSAHAQVREALEQTFTRLQDMLGQQGLQLADAQVSDQSAARQQQGEARGGQGAAGVFADEGDAGPVTMQSLKVPKGLVDYYA